MPPGALLERRARLLRPARAEEHLGPGDVEPGAGDPQALGALELRERLRLASQRRQRRPVVEAQLAIAGPYGHRPLEGRGRLRQLALHLQRDPQVAEHAGVRGVALQHPAQRPLGPVRAALAQADHRQVVQPGQVVAHGVEVPGQDLFDR